MFSAKKIFMAGKSAPPSPTATPVPPTPTPVQNSPLQITSQPQDETVSATAGSVNIGETTWLAGTGFARSNVIWERSIDDGQNWSAYGTSGRQDGALALTPSSFLNGNMFRATAYPYQPFTSLANFSSSAAAESLEVQSGSNLGGLRVASSSTITESVEFLVLAGANFTYSISFAYFQNNYSTSVVAEVLDKQTFYWVQNQSVLGSASGSISLVAGDIVRFTFNTNQPANSFPKNAYSFNFFKGEVEFDDATGVTSEPMTLTAS